VAADVTLSQRGLTDDNYVWRTSESTRSGRLATLSRKHPPQTILRWEYWDGPGDDG
jgi:hypothetical protein